MRDAEKSREELLQEIRDLQRQVTELETGRKQVIKTQEEVKVSEELYRLVVQNAHEGIIIVQDGVFKFLNRKALQFSGLAENDLMGKSFAAFVHPDDREIVLERHRQRIQGETPPLRYTFRFIGPGNKQGIMEIRAVPVTWEGKPATLNFLVDVTESSRQEETLRQSEERYRTLVENTLDGYFVIEIPSCRVLFLNQKSCEMFGYTQDEAAGLNFYDMVTPEDHVRVQENIRSHMDRKDVSVMPRKYKMIRKDGSAFRAEVASALVTFQGVPAVQGTIRDVTEVEQLEKQLQHAQRLALGVQG